MNKYIFSITFHNIESNSLRESLFTVANPEIKGTKLAYQYAIMKAFENRLAGEIVKSITLNGEEG